MRHYYRFMELEPVMEQEEDSVGEGSPTSSMGSPSFSPPPDAWAQISSKEYHDSLSNHLLQDHLDLQRAYRLLEVQLRNCDTRASRDLQRLKEVLPNQDRLREELQRAKERETALRGEIYDLQEQNELLEFRILELEECQENASIRSGNPAGSRDVGTEMESSCDVRSMGQTSLPIEDQSISEAQRCQERLADAPVTPFTSATSERDQRPARALEGAIDSATCQKLAPQLSMTAHHQQYNTSREQLHTSPRKEIDEEVTRSESTQIFPSPDSECGQFSTNAITSLSEGISCTLCRSLPRRRSFPGPSQVHILDADDKDVGIQRDSLRKSNSDGEIKARHDCELLDVDQHPSPVRKSEGDLAGREGETFLNGDAESKSSNVDSSSKEIKDFANVENLDSNEIPSNKMQHTITPQVTVKHAGVQVDVVSEPSRRNKFNGTRVDEQVQKMRSMLNAIYDVLRETRVEVECTNSELREEVQTLETTVQRLTQEFSRPGDAFRSCHESTGTHLASGPPPPVRRSRSLSFSKDCYCCSQELRPTLEEVISKLQQLMDLVVDTSTINTHESNTGEARNAGETVDSDERSCGEETPEEADTSLNMQIVLETHTLPEVVEENVLVPKESRGVSEPCGSQMHTAMEVTGALEGLKGEGHQEIKTKERLMLPVAEQAILGKAVPVKQTFIENKRSKLHQEGWKPGPGIDEQDFVRRSYVSQETSEVPETRTTGTTVETGESVTNKGVAVSHPRGTAEINCPESRDTFRTQDGGTNEEAEEAPNQIEEMDPLPEEKTKPVLRRWREQLLVRRDRVQPWRIEMLDFPKRLPSVV